MTVPSQGEGPHHRLTWGANGPAPYESAWLIFLKLCALNLSGLTYLCSVIKKDDVSVSDAEARYCQGDWIDFRRFSRALGVPEVQLRTGFLDQLGVSSVEDPRWVNIRHCPDCIATGYHSVMFQLDMISHCPWHHQRLVACESCARVFHRGGPWKRKVRGDPQSGKVIKLACGHFTFGSAEAPVLPCLDASRRPLVVQKVEEILAWWHQGIAPSPASRVLSLASTWRQLERRDDTQAKEAQLVLGLFEKISGVLPFKSVTPPLRSQLLAWENQPVDLYQHTELINPDSDLFTFFKCLRRHVKRRHLRQHRRCFNFISHLDEHGAHSLSSDTMCSACLAFMAWEMSLRGITTVAGLRGHFSTPLRTCIPMASLYPEEIIVGFRSIVSFWLAYFYDVWALLELDGRGQQFRLVINEAHFRRDFIRTVYCNSCSRIYAGDVKADKHWLVYAAPEFLAERNNLHCRGRREDEEMLSTRGWNIVAYWSYSEWPNAIFRGWQSEPFRRESLWITV